MKSIPRTQLRKGMMIQDGSFVLYLTDVDQYEDRTVVQGNYTGFNSYSGTTLFFYEDRRIRLAE
jgi:hypothetical protein